MTDDLLLLPNPSVALERAFRAVQAERMHGLAFLNRAIRVEAVDFIPWKTYWLGVMLTPWSMNLMLMPRDTAAWRTLSPGEKRRYTFPAGAFDFISATDDAIGDYLTCSLFSPVLEFADHETARETARLARQALLDPANAEEAPPVAGARTDMTSIPIASASGPVARLGERLATPLSRRDLLHGHVRGNDDAHRG